MSYDLRLGDEFLVFFGVRKEALNFFKIQLEISGAYPYLCGRFLKKV